jgi:hypothetical protein
MTEVTCQEIQAGVICRACGLFTAHHNRQGLAQLIFYL